MVCYHPLQAYVHKFKTTIEGKKLVHVCGRSGSVPWKKLSDQNQWDLTYLPCGQCIGCRLDSSRSWGVRGVHEAAMHKDNCFLTLTYNDDNIVWSQSSGEMTLFADDLQKFWKRLRKRLPDDVKIRYISCGEYGEETHRPHYHALLFGFRPDDLTFYKMSKRGDIYYNSAFLNSVWQKGNVIIGDVNFLTSAYVGRYVTKKLNGEQGKIEYEDIQAPFIRASNRPGIGSSWFVKYYKDIYPYDECIVDYNGEKRRIKPPRYYDKMYEKLDPEGMKAVKERRMLIGKKHEEDIYNDRLHFKELYKMKILDETLRRDLENG